MIRRYLHKLIFCTCGLLALSSAFNYWRDPYGLFHDQDGRNRPEVNSHVRMYKAWQVEQIQPDALILGTSRSDVGLSPSHPAFQGYTAYNLSLGGASMYEILRYYQHARAVRIPKKLVLGLDLLSFHSGRPEQSDFADYRLLGQGTRWGLIQDYLSALVSLDALNDSLHSFATEAAPAPYLRNGQRNPARVAWNGQHEGGQAAAISHLEQAQLPVCFKSNKRRFNANGRPIFEYLRQLLAQAYADGTEVSMLISPYHARMALINDAMDDEQMHQLWLAQVLSINDSLAVVANRPAFPIWDFSGFNPYTTDPILSSNHYYWESSHYQSGLGDLLLNRIFGVAGADPAFGQRLNINSLSDYQHQRQQQHQQYLNSGLTDVTEVLNLIEQRRCAQSPIKPPPAQ